MMSIIDPQSARDEALIDLLVKELTERLTPAERAVIGAADATVVDAYRRELEQAAAAICVAATPATDRLPPELIGRLEQQATAFLAAAEHTQGAGDAARREPQRDPQRSSPRLASAAMAGWWAAAACLLLAIGAWWRAAAPSVAPARQVHQPPPPVSRTPAEERALLLAGFAAVRIPLGATKDPAAAGVSGDVVWDPITQRGFIRFVGMPVNDPKVQQYQIWIFDAERDQRYPVDGGIFDIPTAGGEIIVPVHAGVPVRAAKAFAITIEKPGGVVVSAREHIVALAQAT